MKSEKKRNDILIINIMNEFFKIWLIEYTILLFFWNEFDKAKLFIKKWKESIALIHYIKIILIIKVMNIFFNYNIIII